MKKYVIITPCVTNMGGAQMYVRNKCVYMQSIGWDVDIITSQRGIVYISDLKKYDFIIPELGFDYFLFSKSTRERITNRIIRRIYKKEYDKVIIESTCIPESTWAEAIAKKCGAHHMLYNLQEYNLIKSNIEKDYLKFKYLRHELAGIVNSSLYDMFLPFWPIEKEKSYYLPAYCTNVVEDVELDRLILSEISKQQYDFAVGCLSRIDKPFIVHALGDFLSYAAAHHNTKYLLLMIGGAPEGSSFERTIRKMVNGVKNVGLIITGYLFPVPAKLLDVCDVFFTSAGSSWVCMRSGVPTITYDGNDFKPIGILGRTTNNSLKRNESEPALLLSNLLDDILLKNFYPKKPATHNLSIVDFSMHNIFLSEMESKAEYFDFDKVILSRDEKKLSLLLRLIGAENYYKLGAWKKKVLNKSTSDR